MFTNEAELQFLENEDSGNILARLQEQNKAIRQRSTFKSDRTDFVSLVMNLAAHKREKE